MACQDNSFTLVLVLFILLVIIIGARAWGN